MKEHFLSHKAGLPEAPLTNGNNSKSNLRKIANQNETVSAQARMGPE